VAARRVLAIGLVMFAAFAIAGVAYIAGVVLGRWRS
jgi:hypothetical protein